MQKPYRLRSNEEFRAVYRKRNTVHNRDFTIFIKNNDKKNPRFGICVSKKNGKAYQRNKLKRRIREILRLNFSNINNVDLVIIPKSHTKDMDYDNLLKSIKHCMSFAMKKERIYYVK